MVLSLNAQLIVFVCMGKGCQRENIFLRRSLHPLVDFHTAAEINTCSVTCANVRITLLHWEFSDYLPPQWEVKVICVDMRQLRHVKLLTK